MKEVKLGPMWSSPSIKINEKSLKIRSFEKLKILVVRFGHVGRGQKGPRKVFLGVSSPSGRSQLNIFCVAPPFIGVPASRH